MNEIYVMSDIHGDAVAFHQLLKQVAFHSTDHLYILGDVIDRGPSGIELLQYMKSQPNITLLLGNHEDLMLYFYEERESWLFESWIQNGGTPTYRAFEALPGEEQQGLLQYLKSCPLALSLTVADERYALVHAGIVPTGQDLSQTLAAQTRDDLLWSREDFLTAPAKSLPATIVFGHTPTPHLARYGLASAKEGASGIHQSLNRIGIDCGKAMGQPLGMYSLTSKQAYYEQ